MAEESGPFDNGLWGEDGWARGARLWAPDCVERASNYTVLGDTSLAVTAAGGLISQIGAGNAWVHGFAYRNGSPKTLQHANAPGAGTSRNDLIALRLDRTANTITARVVTGLAAATPVDPVLVQDDPSGIWEMAIARVNVPGAGVNIGAITDLRMFNGRQYIPELWRGTPYSPQAATVGTTAKQVNAMTVPARPYPRIMHVTFSVYCDFTIGTDAFEGQIRNGTISLKSFVESGVGQSISGAYNIGLSPDLPYDLRIFIQRKSGAGVATATSDTTYNILDAMTLPA